MLAIRALGDRHDGQGRRSFTSHVVDALIEEPFLRLLLDALPQVLLLQVVRVIGVELVFILDILVVTLFRGVSALQLHVISNAALVLLL